MKAEVCELAPVLIPNEAHKNFTRTDETIPVGTVLQGEMKIVKGLRRGQPYDYNIFCTDNNKIIFIKYIKPMGITEVTLGADSGTSAKIIDLPNQSNLGKRPVIGAIIGGLAGFGVAKYRKLTSHKSLIIYAAVGAVAGFIAGKYIQSKRPVVVKP